ncbi:MAG TPA: UDP-N-acetylmuramate dehydrogenase [Candidatus Limnocylindrales bacterium]|nr:UDP-N-acetylmuramate dehydrogenase [Candidatus Limnocylindrales bacterium]
MNIKREFSLKNTLWYKIGGIAKYFITCYSRDDMLEALEFVKENKINKVFIVGLGTNLLFSDEYFDGAVIQISANRHPEQSEGSQLDSSAKPQNDIKVGDDGSVEVFAGATMEDLCKFCFEQNLIGLEWAGGLPGTVGGAVRGNAGAYGGEIKDTLVSAEVLDYSTDELIVKTLTNDQLHFSYRNSLIKENKKMVVISAKFQLNKTDSEGLEKARRIYEGNNQNRKDKHPLEYPNTGSVFINPREKEQVEKIISVYPDLKENVEKKWYGKVAVAALIDRWGLKGYMVGDAQISEKHALFIVNLGHAKSADVLRVIDVVKEKFYDTFGFELHVEVEIVR